MPELPGARWRATVEMSSDQASQNLTGDGGLRNCSAWTIDSATFDGTVAMLSPCWQETADCGIGLGEPFGSWWWGEEDSCDNSWGGWCVEDYTGSGSA